METLLYLLYQATGSAPMIPLDEALRPTWLFGQTVHEGCDRGGYYEQAEFTENTARANALSNWVVGGRWSSAMSASVVGYRSWRLPQRWGHLYRLHHAGFPDKFMPFMNQPPGSILSSTPL